MDTLQISVCTHEVVRDETGEIVINENNELLVREKMSDNYFYIPVSNELAQIFGFNLMEEVERDIIYNANVSTDNNNTNANNKWTRNATLLLIELCCNKYRKNFISTTIKNEKVYELVSKDLIENGFNYSANQCRDKFKYLKMRYMKVKDNMKRSGAAPLHFDYFEEMNRYLGEKPNVEPTAIASSSRDNDIIDITDTDEMPAKRRKKETRERAAERRHQERLQMQQKAIDSFENMMQKLIDKL